MALHDHHEVDEDIMDQLLAPELFSNVEELTVLVHGNEKIALKRLGRFISSRSLSKLVLSNLFLPRNDFISPLTLALVTNTLTFGPEFVQDSPAVKTVVLEDCREHCKTETLEKRGTKEQDHVRSVEKYTSPDDVDARVLTVLDRVFADESACPLNDPLKHSIPLSHASVATVSKVTQLNQLVELEGRGGDEEPGKRVEMRKDGLVDWKMDGLIDFHHCAQWFRIPASYSDWHTSQAISHDL
ncbi:hypothetical protein BDQ17DRAFT_1547146 [Cyathus striatus]|nr:hypothetical protein BDQ17DRAFT_1547146 [Cyathus striatus]